MLEVKQLAAGYARVQVLWDIDLTVGENEIVALVGPNGAGKTTLLRAISGMVQVRSGSVKFRGESVNGKSIEDIVARGIAHVPEGRRLFPGLSIRDNLRLGGWRTRNTEIDRVVDLFPRLGERLNQIAGSLSGGEQQMCAIARGLMSEPNLMMIDELSLGLAPVVVDEIIERLPGIAAAGTSILLVDQDVDAALTIAARAYVLEAGHLVLSGAAADLLADPRVQESYLGVGLQGGPPAKGCRTSRQRQSPSLHRRWRPWQPHDSTLEATPMNLPPTPKVTTVAKPVSIASATLALTNWS